MRPWNVWLLPRSRKRALNRIQFAFRLISWSHSTFEIKWLFSSLSYWWFWPFRNNFFFITLSKVDIQLSLLLFIVFYLTLDFFYFIIKVFYAYLPFPVFILILQPRSWHINVALCSTKLSSFTIFLISEIWASFH